MGAFQFVVLSTLRTVQLMRGCLPRVAGTHKPMMTAQFEVAAGMVAQDTDAPANGAPTEDASLDSTAIGRDATGRNGHADSARIHRNV
jgi:hypothetical protein